QSFKRNRLRRGNLDTQRSARCRVIDDEQPIRRCHGPRALLPGWMREVQICRKCPALPIGYLQRALRHWDTSQTVRTMAICPSCRLTPSRDPSREHQPAARWLHAVRISLREKISAVLEGVFEG